MNSSSAFTRKLVAWCMLLILGATGCGSESQVLSSADADGDPKDVVVAFYRALVKGDTKAAEALVVPESRSSAGGYLDGTERVRSFRVLREIDPGTTHGFRHYNDLREYEVEVDAFGRDVPGTDGAQIEFVMVGRVESGDPWRIASWGTGP